MAERLLPVVLLDEAGEAEVDGGLQDRIATTTPEKRAEHICQMAEYLVGRGYYTSVEEALGAR